MGGPQSFLNIIGYILALKLVGKFMGICFIIIL